MVSEIKILRAVNNDIAETFEEFQVLVTFFRVPLQFARLTWLSSTRANPGTWEHRSECMELIMTLIRRDPGGFIESVN